MLPETIKLTDDQLALCESLWVCLKRANSLDGYFAQEHGGTFGHVKDALVNAIASSISTNAIVYFGDSVIVAKRVVAECFDNYENVAYNVDLFNRGIIRVGTESPL